jgi:hypothetical protein
MSILERDQRSSRVEPTVLHFHPIFILSRLAILRGVTSEIFSNIHQYMFIKVFFSRILQKY